MNAPIITHDKINVDIADEVASFTLKAGIAVCALVGTWAVTCLLAALIHVGPVAMVKGYISAITGL